MSKIVNLSARQILDSRGNPTVEVDLMLENNIHGRGMSPSGASTGILEALELRDGDKSIYLGKSVNTAVDNINNKIKKSIINKDLSQKDLDDQKKYLIDQKIEVLKSLPLN